MCSSDLTGIACTPSYALYLAEVVERMGLTKNDINLRIGAFGAEPWTESIASFTRIQCRFHRSGLSSHFDTFRRIETYASLVISHFGLGLRVLSPD